MPEMKVDMSIEVAASPRQLWDWMADIDGWPQWKPLVISSSYITGRALEVGSRFKFKPRMGPVPVTLKPTIIESDPPRRVAWEGSFPGLKAIHSFDFEDLGDGRTRVITRETFSGFGVAIFKLIVPQPKLEKMHEEWLEAFQNKASRK